MNENKIYKRTKILDTTEQSLYSRFIEANNSGVRQTYQDLAMNDDGTCGETPMLPEV